MSAQFLSKCKNLKAYRMNIVVFSIIIGLGSWGHHTKWKVCAEGPPKTVAFNAAQAGEAARPRLLRHLRKSQRPKSRPPKLLRNFPTTLKAQSPSIENSARYRSTRRRPCGAAGLKSQQWPAPRWTKRSPATACSSMTRLVWLNFQLVPAARCGGSRNRLVSRSARETYLP